MHVNTESRYVNCRPDLQKLIIRKIDLACPNAQITTFPVDQRERNRQVTLGLIRVLQV
jgi:hypothetical protein